jgi:heme b synthase
MIKEFIPKWIAWEVTRRCNLKCVHCRSSSELNIEESGFTTEEAYQLLDNIAAYAQPVIVLSGGEPLLRDDIFDIARYGTMKGFRMCMATNGTLVTDAVCQKMKEVGIKIVSLSLDGASAQVHDNFRSQPGAFDGAINAAGMFKRHGIEFIINSSFTKRNQDQIQGVYELAKKLGATAWYMFMIVPTGRGRDILEELIEPEDYEKILNWHYDMEKEEHELLVRPTCAPHYYRIALQRGKEEGALMERRTLKFSTGGAKGCLAGQLIALIDVYGDVLPCSYFPLSAGNVKRESFKTIWEYSQLFNNLRNFKSYKGKCGSCEYINVCGGCRARAYALGNDYLDEEPFCNFIPKRLQKNHGLSTT